MKTRIPGGRVQAKGYALAMVVVFTGVGLMILGGAMQWASQTCSINERNNDYFAAVAAAEGATEKILSQISRDYLRGGEAQVFSRLNTYASAVPDQSESAAWDRFEFLSPQGSRNHTHVERLTGESFVPLNSKYAGLYGLAADYRIVANAREMRNGVTAGVGQEVQVSTIPIFQFAIFYGMDLEINPGPPMFVTGRVHGNENLYCRPNSSLTFASDVTAVGSIFQHRKPGDPQTAGSGPVTFNAAHDAGVNSMNLPIGTNSTPESVRAVLEIPPSNESINSDMGKQRYYNKADLLILVSNNTVTAKSGPGVPGAGVILASNEWSSFLKTNVRFFNKREGLDIQATEIDVSRLRQWTRTNSSISGTLGHDVQSIYVADLRDTTRRVVNTNYSYTTNEAYVTNLVLTTAIHPDYPRPGMYIPPVSTNRISTNSTSVPSSPPAANVVVLTTRSSSQSHPTQGTYIPPVLTNIVKGKKLYDYHKITGYNYDWPVYQFNAVGPITTNRMITTNVFYSTNAVAVTQSAVRLVNGESLPRNGLTVATPNPIYIKGNYNVSSNGNSFTLGSTNTANTLPASIVADAITILSTNWNDASSSLSLSSRVATDTTVNAALLGGIVPTANGYYSGGVENFPRFLEDWNSGGSQKKLTYNGSMVVLFPSRIATAPWGGADVYDPPARNWAFDVNFMDPRKLPPGTPQILKVIRGRWAVLRSGVSSF